jgi:Na+-driven multidrug efflux pump
LRIFLFILIPANAISAATSVSVGQNLGADNIKGAKRAIKLGCLISFVLLSSLGIICFIFAYKIAGFFVNNKNAIVIQETGRFLRAVSLIFGFLGAQLSMLGAFTGSGDTKRSTLLTVLTGGLMLLFGFILSNTKMGYFGLYIAFPLAGFMSLIITYIIYRKENWTHRRITQELENKE